MRQSFYHTTNLYIIKLILIVLIFYHYFILPLLCSFTINNQCKKVSSFNIKNHLFTNHISSIIRCCSTPIISPYCQTLIDTKNQNLSNHQKLTKSANTSITYQHTQTIKKIFNSAIVIRAALIENLNNLHWKKVIYMTWSKIKINK